MTLKDRLPAIAILAILAGGVAVLVGKIVGSSGGETSVAVKVPEFSATAAQGRQMFEANCAECHGTSAAGTDKGPPLVHDIYNPGHHGDAAFRYAVKRGVRQHHWPFGNMPPVPQVSDEEVESIIRYIRELQAANGISYRPHRM